MNQFLQYVINGIAIGSVYALMAVGYSLVYSIMNFSNFAHGGVIMIGAYVGYYTTKNLTGSIWVGIAAAMLFCALLAVLIERVAYNPLRKRSAPQLYYIISAMGMSIFLENIVLATIGPNFKTFNEILANTDFIKNPSYMFGNLVIGKLDILMTIISFTSLALLMLLINKTKIGLAIRATAFNMRASALMGVSTDMIIFIVFGLGGMLAGIAGVMFGLRYTIYPQIGIITNKAFVAAVVGGLGSLPGAILGALVLGLVEVFAIAYISSNLNNLIAFVLLVIMLIFRPTGIMGKSTEDKA